MNFSDIVTVVESKLKYKLQISQKVVNLYPELFKTGIQVADIDE